MKYYNENDKPLIYDYAINTSTLYIVRKINNGFQVTFKADISANSTFFLIIKKLYTLHKK